MTALVSLSAGGAITGFSFAQGAPADLTSPAGLPVHLLALEKSVREASTQDAVLRSAIVNVASYYLHMAKSKTPAEMEAIIWQHASLDGADHGASCAAFASLTLELAAQVVGERSWVTGGTSYPWPLHKWADVRVDPNPASLGVTSVVQDAQAHHRWHPLGDGYRPLPGDWVLFDGHIEVVTDYSGGVLHTIGGDSLPNFSVNAHDYSGPLGAQGVNGFVNNGGLPRAPGHAGTSKHVPGQGGTALPSPSSTPAAGSPGPSEPASPAPSASAAGPSASAAGPSARPPAPPAAASPPLPAGAPTSGPAAAPHGAAVIPGLPVPAAVPGTGARSPRRGHRGHRGTRHHRPGLGQTFDASIPGTGSAWPRSGQRPPGGGPLTAGTGQPVIPGLDITAPGPATGRAAPPAPSPATPPAAPPAPPATSPSTPPTAGPGTPPTTGYHRHSPPAPAAVHETNTERAFISAIAPGAMAAQQKYGVPASVTIAQAIDESGWGRSKLATQDHNLFGIKGRGPAGSDLLQTHEYLNGQLVTRTTSFRVYRNVAESIDDHGRLLATTPYYRTPMAHRHDPNAFAAALTGVYATDPGYGAKLIDLMKRYDLYRFDAGSSAGTDGTPAPGPASPAPAPGGPTPTAVAPSGPAPTPVTPAPTGPAPSPATPTPAAAAPSPATPAPSGPSPTGPSPTGPSSTGPSSTGPSPSGHSLTGPAPTAPAPRRAAPSRATPTGRTPTAPASGNADIPGLPDPGVAAAAAPARPAASPAAAPVTETASESALRLPPAQRPAQPLASRRAQPLAGSQRRISAARRPRPVAARYQPRIPPSVRNAFITAAKGRLLREEPLYRDVASHSGVHWQLLAACDWMQCEARPRFSPVHGEKLGTLNADGTVYRTKSEALAQCADDLIQLAGTVYRIDLAGRGNLSVGELADAFAAFRWGGLLKAHRTSAMEFPYSVAGLTDHHLNMRWPDIGAPDTPDKPGGRFRMPFGAVPVVLCLNYPATGWTP